MRWKLSYILSFLLLLPVFFSCKKENPKPVPTAESYTIKNLSLGIAYPPVRNVAEINQTIGWLNDLGIKKALLTEDWQLREATENNYNWEPLETRINTLTQAGIKVQITLLNAWPAWLNSTGAHTEKNTLNAYRKYIAALLEKFGSKIEKIQYGNEWNWTIDTYFAGNENAFIQYTNILYEEVQKLPKATKPKVVLGSFSGGMRLAADQGLADKIIIEGKQVHVETTKAYLALPADKRITPRVENVLTNTQYDMLDIHVYDDYEAWDKYISAYIASHKKCKQTDVPIMVGEFGGPYAKDLYKVFGKPSPDLLAGYITNYVKTLDSLLVTDAYFFKLTEGGGDVYHYDSYLLTTTLQQTAAYKNLKAIIK